MKVKTPARKVYQYRKADNESMKKELKAFQSDFDREFEIKDVEYIWTLFKNKIHALMEKYIPSKLLHGSFVRFSFRTINTFMSHSGTPILREK